jgi:hypothetical protein
MKASRVGKHSDQLGRRQNRMGEVWAVQLVRCVHPVPGEGCGCVLHQGYVVAELHRIAAGSFDAGVGQQADHDHPVDSVLLELEVEIGVGKAVLGPVLLDDDVDRLRHEIGMPFAPPCAFGKNLPLARSDLVRVRMVPAFIVAGLPAMVRYDEYPDAGLADRGGDGPQIVEQPDLPGDVFDQRPELAPFGQEIIIGIDEEQGRPFLRIAVMGHFASPSEMRGASFEFLRLEEREQVSVDLFLMGRAEAVWRARIDFQRGALEDDGLPRAPILVIDTRSVLRRDGIRHVVSPKSLRSPVQKRACM